MNPEGEPLRLYMGWRMEVGRIPTTTGRPRGGGDRESLEKYSAKFPRRRVHAERAGVCAEGNTETKAGHRTGPPAGTA